jgi:hypothetical protein
MNLVSEFHYIAGVAQYDFQFISGHESPFIQEFRIWCSAKGRLPMILSNLTG